MRNPTLWFLMKGDESLLAAKKRSLSGFDVAIGKWNGVGGKVNRGESIKSAASRELKEEVGVVVREDELEEVGNIKFNFKDKSDWDQWMHIFVARK